MSRSKALLSSVAAAALLAGEAMSQESSPSAVESGPPTEQEIVVTGTRLTDPGAGAATPLTSVTSEQLQAAATPVLGDVLNRLPSISPTSTQANSSYNTAFGSTVGANFLDLRGLGVNRSLILINGRRHVGSNAGSSEVDINTIPVDLLRRVDVITGGAAAVYGSDAVSGVVNFVLDDAFQGVKFRAQAGVSSRGDAGNQLVSATFGTGFADGRGNVAISLEHARQSRVEFSDRSYVRDGFTFVSNPLDTGNNDGIPNFIQVRGVRSTNFPTQGGVVDPSDPAELTRLVFNSDGTLRPINLGTAVYDFGASAVNGDGANLSDVGTLRPRNMRTVVSSLAHYDFSPAARLFVEGKYARVKASFFGQPTFGLASFLPLTTTFDNPYLPQQARDELAALGYVPGDSVRLNRFNLDFGRIGRFADRETFRGVIGVRGKLSDRWSYEASYVYGRTAVDFTLTNRYRFDRLALSLDVVADASGNPVCRAVRDAGSGQPSNSAAIGCVPVNILGAGNVSQAARNYFNASTIDRSRLTQQVATAFVTGDTGGFLELPGGPIGLVAGTEYRRESNRYRPDPLNVQGAVFVGMLEPLAGKFDVKEAFAEANFPLLKNVPFAQELSVSAAVRLADYSSVGSATTWKAGLLYEPVEGLRFRAGYARAVRAPNIGELFSPQQDTFLDIEDPCSVELIQLGSPSRQTNCRAAGVPENFIAPQTTPRGRVGGNPDLDAETSKSLTIGMVLAPRALRGLTVAVDYYDIKIDDAISAVDAQDIVNRCVDAATLENDFCDSVRRFGAGSSRPGAIDFVAQTPLNIAALRARGVDLELAYRRSFAADRSIGLRLLGTRVLKREDFPFQSDPDASDRILGELGTPKWRANLYLDGQLGAITARYGVRWIGSQLAGVSYEDALSTPDVQSPLRTGSVFYHDIRIGFMLGDRFDFALGSDNLLDRKPPAGLFGVFGGEGIYDNLGRTLYATASLRF